MVPDRGNIFTTRPTSVRTFIRIKSSLSLTAPLPTIFDPLHIVRNFVFAYVLASRTFPYQFFQISDLFRFSTNSRNSIGPRPGRVVRFWVTHTRSLIVCTVTRFGVSNLLFFHSAIEPLLRPVRVYIYIFFCIGKFRTPTRKYSYTSRHDTRLVANTALDIIPINHNFPTPCCVWDALSR